MVAGVLFAPTLVLLALAVAPFVDRNPSTKPGDRKIAITMFTMLMMFGATLTIIGSFFRGTGYNWVWPWAQGSSSSYDDPSSRSRAAPSRPSS